MGNQLSPDDLSIIRRAATLLGLAVADLKIERREERYLILAYKLWPWTTDRCWGIAASSRLGYWSAVEDLAASISTRRAVATL